MSHKPKVLIIDDEADLAHMFSLFLKSEGFDVMSALDGPTGIELAVDYKPNIILLDIIMPIMDGWEVCKKLKSDDLTAAIPVIILTASPSNDVEEKGQKVGASFVMLKPCLEQLLIEAINQLLGRNEMDSTESMSAI